MPSREFETNLPGGGGQLTSHCSCGRIHFVTGDAFGGYEEGETPWMVSRVGPGSDDVEPLVTVEEGLFDEEPVETCRICGCTDEHGCQMGFGDETQMRAFIRRYATAEQAPSLLGMVGKIHFRPPPSPPEDCAPGEEPEEPEDEMVGIPCWWFADNLCVPCIAELDQAMGVLGLKDGDDEPMSLAGAIEIKSAYTCFPDGHHPLPHFRDMSTWTAPEDRSVEEVLHELPALLEEWATERGEHSMGDEAQEFGGGPFEHAPEGYGADDPPEHWSSIELGTADPCALCKHPAHYPRQCAGPEHEGKLDWGCECEYGHEEGDTKRSIGHMLDLLRVCRTYSYATGRKPTRSAMLAMIDDSSATLDALLELLKKEGQPLELAETDTPPLKLRPMVWIYDDAGVKVGYVLRLENDLAHGELTGNLGRLDLKDTTPITLRCIVRPAKGRVQCSVRPNDGPPVIGFVDWPKSLERPASIEVPDCVALTTEIITALLLTIPGEVKCVACHGTGEACSRCNGSTREDARRTKDGGFFCNRCFRTITRHQLLSSLEKYAASGFITCPGCGVCYHAHETELPGVDIHWWSDLSSVYGAIRSRPGKTWGVDDELLPYLRNYPRIVGERMRDLLKELERKGKIEIDRERHGWRDAKGLKLRDPACVKKGEHLKKGWCRCDMYLPIGKTCAGCAHIKRCTWLISVNPENTTCDWSPSRYLEPHEFQAGIDGACKVCKQVDRSIAHVAWIAAQGGEVAADQEEEL